MRSKNADLAVCVPLHIQKRATVTGDSLLFHIAINPDCYVIGRSKTIKSAKLININV